MYEDVATYEQAYKLKQLGFDCGCTHGYYFNNKEAVLNLCGYAKNTIGGDFFFISAPTLSQVQKWLREKHYLSIEIYTSLDINSNWEWDGFVKNLNDTLEDEIEDTAISCKTYEEALSKCIDKAIELLKENKK